MKMEQENAHQDEGSKKDSCHLENTFLFRISHNIVI